MTFESESEKEDREYRLAKNELYNNKNSPEAINHFVIASVDFIQLLIQKNELEKVKKILMEIKNAIAPRGNMFLRDIIDFPPMTGGVE